jgi:hypothetical protein
MPKTTPLATVRRTNAFLVPSRTSTLISLVNTLSSQQPGSKCNSQERTRKQFLWRIIKVKSTSHFVTTTFGTRYGNTLLQERWYRWKDKELFPILTLYLRVITFWQTPVASSYTTIRKHGMCLQSSAFLLSFLWEGSLRNIRRMWEKNKYKRREEFQHFPSPVFSSSYLPTHCKSTKVGNEGNTHTARLKKKNHTALQMDWPMQCCRTYCIPEAKVLTLLSSNISFLLNKKRRYALYIWYLC